MRIQVDHERIAVLTIKDRIIQASGAYLRRNGFTEILPVLLSPITDPLHHETYGGAVDYYGTPYQLTRSMILHKQLALRTLPKIFCFSPNVRMEPAERAVHGRYLAEFVQLDLEVRDASRDDVIAVGEELLVCVIEQVLTHCRCELELLGREIRVPSTPLARIPYNEAEREFGVPFDDALSATLASPAWVVDFPRTVREFYDREDPTKADTLLDMDLMYPEGFGEALSGGEREHTLPRILRRMEQDAIAPERFRAYLDEVERGIPASAGFGIGVERLTRFVAGLDRVEDARLFAKTPGATQAI
ncbi:asparagine synthetase [Candidatus Bipolaricaulota bacterium]|nr:asparagine synthetase [Candidatus Bipolaricaulota bacterium]